MNIVENQKFDKEIALYGSSELLIKNCSFDGPADGLQKFNRRISKLNYRIHKEKLR